MILNSARPFTPARRAAREGEASMVNHGPNCLEGPVSRTSPWWTTFAAGKDRPIRHELVERVRREIAEGTYDTPEKWEAALDRLYERLEDDR
jgi:hypothetical protein